MRHEAAVMIANAVTSALLMAPSLDGKWVALGDVTTLTIVDPTTNERVSTGYTVWEGRSGKTWLRLRDMDTGDIISDERYNTRREAMRIAEAAKDGYIAHQPPALTTTS